MFGRFFSRLALLSAAFAPSWASADEPLFLVPQNSVLTGQKAALDLKTGAGPTAPKANWKDHAVRWVFVKTGQIQENRDSVDGWLDPQGVFVPPVLSPGAVVVGVDFAPTLEDLSVGDLRRLLVDAAPPKSATVKVKHFRSAVAILRTSWSVDDDPASHVAVAETGLACEIRPLMDPTRLPSGADIKFEIAQRGREVEEAELRATSLVTGRTLAMAPDRAEGLNWKPESSGLYGLSCTFALPLKNDPEASYAVYSATVCFAVPDRKGVGR